MKDLLPPRRSRRMLAALLVALPAAAAVQPIGPQGSGLPHALRELAAQPIINDGAERGLELTNGVYFLSEPLRFSAEESGTAAKPLVIRAAPGTHPVLSGGRPIQGWEPATNAPAGLPTAARGHIWTATAPETDGKPLLFRQIWVNGRKAMRARNPGGEQLERLTGWDKKKQVAFVPRTMFDGISPNETAGMEMVVDQVWEIAILRVKDFRLNGDAAEVTFMEPESRLEFQHPWPPVQVNAHYAAPCYLVNHLGWLTKPGEWFEDVAAGKVYYWPRPGEDMATAEVMAPALETLVQIEGTPEHPAGHVQFSGITFANTTWLRPSEQGHVPLQAGMYLLDAKKLKPHGTSYHPGLDNLAWIGRPPAAVQVKYADGVVFKNCRFEQLASAGLDLGVGTHEAVVTGCVFTDIGGNGLQAGQFSEPKVETHVPYADVPERDVCTGEDIADNLFTDCANEDWGCVGIAAGYVRSTRIEHNEVFNLPYTGISLGWGWTKQTNVMRDNRVVANRINGVGQKLGDWGGIYLLSAQPGTVVAENEISNLAPSPYVPDPDHWYYLYLDEGSSLIQVRDNWCPAEKFLRNANGPGNVWSNNGPHVADKIRAAAGLEPAYLYLLRPYLL